VKTEAFLEGKFREYYRENSHKIMPPLKLDKREFGFIYFKDKIMVRHRQFTSANELRRFVEDSAPSDVYYSTAYYSNPEEEMERKDWLGADLVFDIDADHIPTRCKEAHDRWTCKACGRSGKGTAPQACPSCKNERFEERTWVCETCLEQAKNEALKLVEFLMEDYGFSKMDLKAFFTGHRGYHIHVMSDAVHNLDSDERKEIVDYVLGIGLDLDMMDILEKHSTRPSLPENSDEVKGWKRRIIRKLVDTLANSDENELTSLGMKNTIARTIIEERGSTAEYQDMRNIIEGLDTHIMGNKRWEKTLKKIIEDCSARIDTVVTTDLHRLIRTKETLNGKTGLRTMEINVDELESFDPFEEAVGIKCGQETIEVDEAPEFRLSGSTYGPFNKQRVTLPAAAAVLLVGKGKAHPVM
jgi:DNA primase small subunit